MRHALPVLMLLTLVSSTSAQSPSLEFLKPSVQDEEALDVSRDGRFVSGGGASATGWIWDGTTGQFTDMVGTPGRPAGVTDDGSTAVGVFANVQNQLLEGAVWTATGGFQLIGNPFGSGCSLVSSTLQDIDADGDVAVGSVTIDCSLTVPVRLTTGLGLQTLSRQWPDSSASTRTVSADGQRVGGYDFGFASGPGAQPRACVWTSPTTQVFVAVSAANPDGWGSVLDLNNDGSRACGEANGVAFTWQDGVGPTPLDKVPGLTGLHGANGLSDDGSVAVGYGLSGSTVHAVLWTAATGAVRLVDWLAGQGLAVAPSRLRNAIDVSGDGTVIIGNGSNGPWVLTLADDGPWLDLGQGLAGTGGQAPVLAGQGSLLGGTSTTLSLSGARPSASTWLVMGFDPLGASFKGGVLVPDADLLVGPFPTSPAGTLDLIAVWPGNLPSGTELWWQEWIADPLGPAGFAASNGLKSTTP